MKLILALLGLFIACALAVNASTTVLQECPAIAVAATPLASQPKPTFVFEARLSETETKGQPTYNWTISAGTIKKGQGTSAITVELTDPQDITATVTVRGFAAHCPTTASYTLVAEVPRKLSTKFGEYNPNSTNAKQLLDKFSTVVKSTDDTKVYILAYGGSSRKHSEAEMAGDRARNYLIGVGVAVWRIEFVDGGFREEPAVELWLTPPGATPPTPEPTIPDKKPKSKQ